MVRQNFVIQHMTIIACSVFRIEFYLSTHGIVYNFNWLFSADHSIFNWELLQLIVVSWNKFYYFFHNKIYKYFSANIFIGPVFSLQFSIHFLEKYFCKVKFIKLIVYGFNSFEQSPNVYAAKLWAFSISFHSSSEYKFIQLEIGAPLKDFYDKLKYYKSQL